jgi:hypothetical protein
MELLVLVENGMVTMLTRDAGVRQAQHLVADALGASRGPQVDELIRDRRREAVQERDREQRRSKGA